MIRVNKGNLTLSLIAMAVISGCSNTDNIASAKRNQAKTELIQAKVIREYDTDQDRQTSAPYFYSNDFFVLGRAFELTQELPLPPIFDQTTSVKIVDKQPIENIFEKLNASYQQYGLVVTMTKRAGEHLKEIAGEDSSSSTSSSLSESSDSASTVILPIQQVAASEVVTASEGRYAFEMNLIVQNTSLRGILDLIGSSAGLWWKFEDGRVIFYRTTEKTFLLDISDQAFAISSSQNGVADGESGGGSASITTSSDAVKPLEEVESQLRQYLTKDGELIVNKFDKTVTVRDTPTSLKKVTTFLDDFNYRATTAYAVTTDVYEIISEIVDDRGIDWSAAFDSGGRILSAGLSPTLGVDPTAGSLSFSVGSGNWADSATGIKFLNENSSLYSKIHNVVKTKNNIPTQVVSNEDQAILSGRSITVDGNGFAQESTETKLIDQGFAISTRPKMTSKGRVDMEVTITSKSIKGVEEFGNEDNAIQQEETRTQSVISNVILNSGESAVITAYERELTSSDISTLSQDFSWWAGGQSTKQRFKSSLVIIVKPVVLER